LVRPLGTIFPVAVATISMWPKHAQASAEHGDDGDADRVAERRNHDLEGSRQERELVLAA
jgi:hypothetical protein